MHLQREDRAANCYAKWCEGTDESFDKGEKDIREVIKKLTITGIAKYSL